ncbi:MAG: hypothetical protein JWM27_328 [Gemmatimonadetes bacterium]|nr:hypothetical protein [Gemmatimonadota bacterium]
MRHRSLALAALLAAALAPTPAAGQGDGVARFNRLVDGMDVAGDARPTFAAPEHPPARVAAVWEAMDSVVLRQLARGGVEGVNPVLARLHGFQPSDPGDGQTVGAATFYGRLPRELPSYFVFALDSAGTRALGVYSLGFNAPGRIAAYARRGGRWTRVGAAEGRWPMQPFLLQRAGGGFGIATVETFVGGDRQDCWLKLWTLDGAGLRRDRAFPRRMVDCEARGEPGAIRVAFDDFPVALDAGVMGARLRWLRTLRLEGGAWSVVDERANPWVHLPEQYYVAVMSHRPAQARTLLADSSLAASLGVGRTGVFADSGDLAAGSGSITIGRPVGGLVRYQRVESRRGADGVWRIVRVAAAAEPDAAK